MKHEIPAIIFDRKEEITASFIQHIDAHLNDIVCGNTIEMCEIRDIAKLMFIHPTHLSNTIKVVTGQAPCYFFEMKIMDHAKKMLADPNLTIAHIALTLTFDPSNFTKFFKRFEGITPKQYRLSVAENNIERITQ